MANFYFDYSVGDWSDTTKWYLDINKTIPAGTLPTSSDDVYIDAAGAAVYYGSASSPTCNNLYLLTGVSFRISVTVAGTAFFYGVSDLSDDFESAVIVGNAEFRDNSSNNGSVTGNAHFYETAYDSATASASNLYLHSPHDRYNLYGTYANIIYQGYTLYLNNDSWYLEASNTSPSPNGSTSTDDVVVQGGGFDISGSSVILWENTISQGFVPGAKDITVENGAIYDNDGFGGGSISINSITLNNSSYIGDASVYVSVVFNDNSYLQSTAQIVYPGSATFNDNSKNFGTIGSEVDPIGATVNFPVKLPLGGTVYGGITYSGYNPLVYNNNILGIL